VIRRLFTIPLSRLALGSVIAVSALATGVVIATARDRSSLSTTAAAFMHRRIELRNAEVASAGGGSGGGDGGALLSGGSSSPSAPAATTTTTTTSTPTTASSTPTTTTTTSTTPTTTPVAEAKHVFVISLTTTSYKAAFGHGSVATYLNRTLRAKGTLLSGYHSLTGAELPDELAMVSGQPVNPLTSQNCPAYDDFSSSAKANKAGLVTGKGCVYPNTITTVGDQVTGAGAVWKAYIADMGKQSCIHPNSGATDDAVLPFATDQYDTRHNPFIYFHSLLDLGGCSSDDVDLTALPADLSSAKKTPLYSFIAPPLCDDSSVSACADGQPGGLAGEDAFLKAEVPQILSSAAYKDKGVLMIVFAPSTAAAGSAAQTGATTATGTTTTTTTGTATTTTGTTTAPYTMAPTTVAVPGSGGDSAVRTGALIISSFAKAGTTVNGKFTPDSVLRSVEQLLGLNSLGLAATAPSFVKAALPGA
jgi:phosphatidylinositol-3-phosphatase